MERAPNKKRMRRVLRNLLMALVGLVLLAAFILHEILIPHPWLNLRLIIRGPLPLLLLTKGGRSGVNVLDPDPVV